MNEDTIKGKWKQLSGKIQAKWGKLTNDDIDGNRHRNEHQGQGAKIFFKLFGKTQLLFSLLKNYKLSLTNNLNPCYFLIAPPLEIRPQTVDRRKI